MVDWDNLEKLIQAGATIISIFTAIVALMRGQEQAERLKVLEAELSRTTFEYETQFTKLHEKRAEVISEIYRRVVVLEIWLNHIVGETELPDEVFTSPKDFAKDFDAVFGQISLNLQDLAAYFNMNRLYLSENLCQKILGFHNAILEKDDPIYGYFYQRFKQRPESEISEIYGGDLRKRAYKVLKEISDSRRAIENDFRDLLGIRDRKGHAEDQLQIDNDLMWIPTPESIDPLKWSKPNK